MLTWKRMKETLFYKSQILDPRLPRLRQAGRVFAGRMLPFSHGFTISLIRSLVSPGNGIMGGAPLITRSAWFQTCEACEQIGKDYLDI